MLSRKIKLLFIGFLVLKIATCISMFVLLLVYWIHALIAYEMVPRYWILALFLLPGIIASFIIQKQVFRDTVKHWPVWVFGIESIFTLWVAYCYFSGPMHDIALDYFGHHGRFGASSLDGPFCHYFVNDVTLSLMLFLPSMVLGIIYFIGMRLRPEVARLT